MIWSDLPFIDGLPNNFCLRKKKLISSKLEMSTFFMLVLLQQSKYGVIALSKGLAVSLEEM
jgi:hypothetical protein